MVLADSQEAPLLEDELPQGVESVVRVTEEQAEAGRALLLQQVACLPSCFKLKPDISGHTFLTLLRKDRKDEYEKQIVKTV